MALEIKDLHLNHAFPMPHCNNSILSSTVHPKVRTPFSESLRMLPPESSEQTLLALNI